MSAPSSWVTAVATFLDLLHCRRSAVALAIAMAAAIVAGSPDVGAAKSGVQQSRDGRVMLISKDVGNERWAISYDLENHTVIGNVFLPSGGNAAFVWCEQTRTNGDTDARRVQLTFACYGADPCDGEPCGSAEWSSLGEVTLPGEFFLPPADPVSTATPAPIIVPTATRTPNRTPTPVATPDVLRDLLGTWTFETTIISVFLDHYRLEKVETIDGVRVISGTDLDDGGSILVARPSDLIDDPFPYDYAMLDPGNTICDFFVFSKTGPDSVAGADFLTDASAGRCGSFLTGTPHSMVGSRTARISSFSRGVSPHADDVLGNRENMAAAEDAGIAGSVAQPNGASTASNVAARLMDVMERSGR